MVQDIDRINSEFELFAFGNLEALHQVHIEVEPRRPANRALSECANLSGLRVHEDDVAVRIGDRFVVIAGE